jgi:hypothetical protein
MLDYFIVIKRSSKGVDMHWMLSVLKAVAAVLAYCSLGALARLRKKNEEEVGAAPLPRILRHDWRIGCKPCRGEATNDDEGPRAA